MKLRSETMIDPQEVLDALYRNSVAAFGERAFAVLEPMRRFERSLPTQALPHFLDRVRQGFVKRGVVNMPPRSGKSTWASVIFAAFMHGLDPTMRIVCISYSAELAAKHARDYRALITSAWYQRLFPGTRIDPAKNSESEITLIGGGYRLAS